MATAVEELRGFNRFYTQQIGLLSEGLTGSPFSLAEARVLYELASGAVETAADLSRALSMDKAHLSRILARFKSQGLDRINRGCFSCRIERGEHCDGAQQNASHDA